MDMVWNENEDSNSERKEKNASDVQNDEVLNDGKLDKYPQDPTTQRTNVYYDRVLNGGERVQYRQLVTTPEPKSFTDMTPSEFAEKISYFLPCILFLCIGWYCGNCFAAFFQLSKRDCCCYYDCC
uniref:Uncharacterized protein n=1 Tax=Cacopsylla melanoneura TaxID=428564 RepID=A0A8D8ZD66_9HEMI